MCIAFADANTIFQPTAAPYPSECVDCCRLQTQTQQELQMQIVCKCEWYIYHALFLVLFCYLSTIMGVHNTQTAFPNNQISPQPVNPDIIFGEQICG